MLQVIAVGDMTTNELEKATKGIAQKSHQRPAELDRDWAVKVFGSRSPKIETLDGIARRVAKEKNTLVLVARIQSSGWDEYTLLHSAEPLLTLQFPRHWFDCRDPDDAWEYCVETFGDPAEVTLVAGLDPKDEELQFLWDEDEAAIVEENVVANNSSGFIQRLLDKLSFKLPSTLRQQIEEANSLEHFFQTIFNWQYESLVDVLKYLDIHFDQEVLQRCFGIQPWKDDWIDSPLGNFPAMLSCIGVNCVEQWLENNDADELIESLNARKSFKEGKGVKSEPQVWFPLSSYSNCQDVVERHLNLESVEFDSGPLIISTTQIGRLFQLPWSVDKQVDWVLEIDLPEPTFPLDDGTQFEWWRLHCRTQGNKEVYWFREGERRFVRVFYAPRWFFPDPEGEAAFAEVAHNYTPLYPPEQRVRFHQMLETLPDGTKLSLLTHSYKPLPMTTLCFKGEVESGQFHVNSRYPRELSKDDLEQNIKFFEAAHSRINFEQAANEFMQSTKGTFWDPEPFRPKPLKRAGRLLVQSVPERAISGVRERDQQIAMHKKELEVLGFRYVGTIAAPDLGSVEVKCFAGPGDCVAHLIIEYSARPEFWTRFESGDILTTNTTDFFGASTNYPKRGLYYRTYYDRPLSALLDKHRDGIERFRTHKSTAPVQHEPTLDAFADNLIHWVSKHPDFRRLVV